MEDDRIDSHKGIFLGCDLNLNMQGLYMKYLLSIKGFSALNVSPTYKKNEFRRFSRPTENISPHVRHLPYIFYIFYLNLAKIVCVIVKD